ncbi:hypothetical protein [Caballeronia sp. LZ035]|uniref:hypothetical protein n=1 Tax=Caballeronia sp. LZ035 TaxID=3038568 RepID=UPI00285574CA|nr:hypothetical protein [Caballeronia sp. LZ035]MDR5761463.1 hypothetical protein [Caballeronia sp. LZ035]
MRRVLFAVEIVDAVTLDPVTTDIVVSAEGLLRKPVVNHAGLYVFLAEGDALPANVIVSAEGSPYESVTVAAPVPPARMVRVQLAPRYAYPFVAGVTAMRGALIESVADDRVPVVDAVIGLQWLDQLDDAGVVPDARAGDEADLGGPDDDVNPKAIWIDPGLRSHSAATGDFAAVLRLTPSDRPARTIDGALRVRLRVERGNAVRMSDEFPLWQGRVADALPPFAWDELEL